MAVWAVEVEISMYVLSLSVRMLLTGVSAVDVEISIYPVSVSLGML